MKKILLTIAFVFLTLPAMAAVSVGEMAPDFSLVGHDGDVYSLGDYKGSVTVLEWTNHDCPFVRKHYDDGHMQSLQETYTAQGVTWLSINSSAPGKQGHCPSPEYATTVVESKQAKPTALLLDHDGDIGNLYGAKTTPHMFVIDETGEIVYQGAIDSTPSADPADIATSENYVVSALDAVLAGQKVAMSKTKPYGCSVKY